MGFFRKCAPLTLALLSISVLASGGTGVSRKALPSEIDPVVQDLCGKRVALLGESPLHGSGTTFEFKATLVRRLVDECHYNAFFIESGTYDFLDIQKKLTSGENITPPILTAAIGGLWRAREVEPLISFLVEKANAGNVFLGGFDDQLQRGTYAQHEMPGDLVQYLQGDAKRDCLHILERHTLWQYTDNSPYSPADKGLILGCVDQIEAAASNSRRPGVTYDLAMLRSLRHSLAGDFAPDNPGKEAGIEGFNDRDHSMYRNFQWWMSRLPAGSKVIVWTAANHAARDLSGVGGQEALVSLGSYIHREFKSRAFALGFSAYSGSYARVGQPPREWTIAPENSLEGQAFASGSSDIRYLNSGELRKVGRISARPISADFKIAKWDEVLDGIVIFREDRPPTFSKP
jgi:erythromycin esterase-like protein